MWLGVLFFIGLVAGIVLVTLDDGGCQGNCNQGRLPCACQKDP